MLEVTEVSYFVMLLNTVIVNKRKMAPNCLQTRCYISKPHPCCLDFLCTIIGQYCIKTA